MPFIDVVIATFLIILNKLVSEEKSQYYNIIVKGLVHSTAKCYGGACGPVLKLTH